MPSPCVVYLPRIWPTCLAPDSRIIPGRGLPEEPTTARRSFRGAPDEREMGRLSPVLALTLLALGAVQVGLIRMVGAGKANAIAIARAHIEIRLDGLLLTPNATFAAGHGFAILWFSRHVMLLVGTEHA